LRRLALGPHWWLHICSHEQLMQAVDVYLHVPSPVCVQHAVSRNTEQSALDAGPCSLGGTLDECHGVHCKER
jgi:hypothetical protein